MSSKTRALSIKQLLEINVDYGRRNLSQVFSDFCEMAAIALRNTVDVNGRQEREERYSQITSDYSPEEVTRFAHMLALLGDQIEHELSDVLGSLYMSLDFGRSEMGQFFTPYSISQLVAQMSSSDQLSELETKEFITLSEPTCGSGGMVIAMAEVMRDAGFNYQRQLHVTAQDLERTAVHMTYVSLSLLHIPAMVIHGNTLTSEVRDCWYTPAHIMGGWSRKLRAQSAQKSEPGTEKAA